MTDPNSKETNPKDAIGADKLPLHLWPPAATAMGCVGLAEGATKYGRANWRAAGVKASIYYDACRRHLDAWFEGEEVAPDSDVPHLANALACLAIIVDAQSSGKLVDDRNFQGGGYRTLVEALTPHIARLKALHADKAPKHWDKRVIPGQGYGCVAIDPEQLLTPHPVPAFHRPLPDGFTWGMFPEWALWFAIDGSGVARVYRGQPKVNHPRGWWWAPTEDGMPVGAGDPGNWRESLRRRPLTNIGQSVQHHSV